MNQSEKEIFIRFLKDEIKLINDRYKSLTADPSELSEFNETLQHLQRALNAVEKPIKNEGEL